MITIAICDDDTQNLSETKEQITAWAKEQEPWIMGMPC